MAARCRYLEKVHLFLANVNLCDPKDIQKIALLSTTVKPHAFFSLSVSLSLDLSLFLALFLTKQMQSKH